VVGSHPHFHLLHPRLHRSIFHVLSGNRCPSSEQQQKSLAAGSPLASSWISQAWNTSLSLKWLISAMSLKKNQAVFTGDRFQQDSPSEPDLEAGWSFSTVSKLSIGLQIPWWVAGTIRLLLLPLNQKYIEDFHRRVVSSKETLWIRQRRKTGYVYSWHDFGLNVEKTGDVIHMYVYIYICMCIYI
jgi:hypothetical protein